MKYLTAGLAMLAASPSLAHHSAQDAALGGHSALWLVLLCGAASVAALALRAMRGE